MLWVALGRCWAPLGAPKVAKGLKKEGRIEVWILQWSHKGPNTTKLEPQDAKIGPKVLKIRFETITLSQTWWPLKPIGMTDLRREGKTQDKIHDETSLTNCRLTAQMQGRYII